MTHVGVVAALVFGAPNAGLDRVGGTVRSSVTSFEKGPQKADSHVRQAPAMPTGARLRSTGRCRGIPGETTAAQLTSGMANFRENSWKWADGGVSARLGDGRVLWFFGDTIREPTAAARNSIAPNSLLLSRGACFDQVLGEADGHVLPDIRGGASGFHVWPTAVVAVDHGTWDEVIVFGVAVHRTGGFWGFELGGTTLTRFVVPRGGTPQRVDQFQLTPNTFDENAVGWGTGAQLVGDQLFVFGTKREAERLGRSVYLARVPFSRVVDRAAWQFRSASGWGAERDAVPLLPAKQGVSHIIGTYVRDGKPHIVSKVGGDLGDHIGVWRASGFGEPFELVRTAEHKFRQNGERVEYMPLAHPEFNVTGQVLVTMSRNTLKSGVISHDWSLGRPIFFTIDAG